MIFCIFDPWLFFLLLLQPSCVVSFTPLHDLDLLRPPNHSLPRTLFLCSPEAYIHHLLPTSSEMCHRLSNSACLQMDSLAFSIHYISSSFGPCFFPQRIQPPVPQELDYSFPKPSMASASFQMKRTPSDACSGGHTRQSPTTTSSLSPVLLVTINICWITWVN